MTPRVIDPATTSSLQIQEPSLLLGLVFVCAVKTKGSRLQQRIFCLNRPDFSLLSLKLLNSSDLSRSSFAILRLCKICYFFSIVPTPPLLFTLPSCTPLLSFTHSSPLVVSWHPRLKSLVLNLELLNVVCLLWQISRFRGSQPATITTMMVSFDSYLSVLNLSRILIETRRQRRQGWEGRKRWQRS